MHTIWMWRCWSLTFLQFVREKNANCLLPLVIAEFGQKCLEIAFTLKYEPLNSCITVHSIWIMKIFNIMFPNTCSRNKRRKNCEESRWRSQSALVRPLAMSCLSRCQDLIGSSALTQGLSQARPLRQSRPAIGIVPLKNGQGDNYLSPSKFRKKNSKGSTHEKIYFSTEIASWNRTWKVHFIARLKFILKLRFSHALLLFLLEI